jgi:hypothetical protein
VPIEGQTTLRTLPLGSRSIEAQCFRACEAEDKSKQSGASPQKPKEIGASAGRDDSEQGGRNDPKSLLEVDRVRVTRAVYPRNPCV